MNPQKMKEAYQRLERLDDRLSYKLRSGGHSMVQPTADQINAKVRDLAEFSLELKEILREFMLSFASRPRAAGQPPGGTPPGGSPPGGPPAPPIG